MNGHGYGTPSPIPSRTHTLPPSPSARPSASTTTTVQPSKAPELPVTGPKQVMAGFAIGMTLIALGLIALYAVKWRRIK